MFNFVDRTSFQIYTSKMRLKKFKEVIVEVSNDFVSWIEVLLVGFFKRPFDANLVL